MDGSKPSVRTTRPLELKNCPQVLLHLIILEQESGLKNFSLFFYAKASPIKQICNYFVLYYIFMQKFYFNFAFKPRQMKQENAKSKGSRFNFTDGKI